MFLYICRGDDSVGPCYWVYITVSYLSSRFVRVFISVIGSVRLVVLIAVDTDDIIDVRVSSSSFCSCDDVGAYCDDDGGLSSSFFCVCGGVGEYPGDDGGDGGDGGGEGGGGDGGGEGGGDEGGGGDDVIDA